MNPIIRELLNINRFEFINISGSIVLNKILIDNNIDHDWNSNDLDIYISINNTSFNTFMCLDYIKEILTCLTQGTYNQNQFIINNLSNYAYEISEIVANAYINKLQIIDNNQEPDDDDSYVNISNNILDVIKLSYDNIYIDFIFIDIEIDNYITQNFDLTIVQNYINYQNTIIQFNKINYIKQSISGFNLNKWNDIISHNSKYNISKFIDRIYKYNNRGFKIYLNYLKCSCNQINCLCTIKLDYDFINIINQGYISFYNIYYGFIDDLLIKKYCFRYQKNHFGKCIGHYNSEPTLCNKEISYLKINNYKSKPLSDIYNNFPIVMLTIINKIVLLRELNVNYSLHPNNLLNVFDDLLE